MAAVTRPLKTLVSDIERCRICVEAPLKNALPHEPRPVLRVSSKARLAICGQAPGKLVHKSGVPFTDPSGVRLREWMGVSDGEFYDRDKIAIIPMGFCFPGYTEKGADLPPRKECAINWREKLMTALPALECMLLVGGYAQKWHLAAHAKPTLTQTVGCWRDFAPSYFPMPHPSWRNNAWLKKNPWFESELLPEMRKHIHGLIR